MLFRSKLISRQTYLSGKERKENDAEHAWHMALMAVLLSEYSNEPIDVLKTVTMLLIHDLVEIDAGDTYAYDEEAKKSQKKRELAAADRIFGLLPADQRESLRGLWEEFEACVHTGLVLDEELHGADSGQPDGSGSDRRCGICPHPFHDCHAGGEARAGDGVHHGVPEFLDQQIGRAHV